MHQWISISFEDKDPEFAVAMINRYLNELDNYLRSEAINRAMDNRRYLTTLMKAQTDKDIKERLNALVLSQMEQAMYAETKSAFLYEVVDPPVLPKYPSKPNRPLTLILAFVVALMAGFMISLLINVHLFNISSYRRQERGNGFPLITFWASIFTCRDICCRDTDNQGNFHSYSRSKVVDQVRRIPRYRPRPYPGTPHVLPEPFRTDTIPRH